MREGPDIARIASLVGDPARANMLNALMGGTALTASELALEAGVSLPTASSHLSKLMEGGLLTLASQGRHRYYGLAGPQVAGMIEAITGVAEAVGPKRVRPGPRDGAMRVARVCYDHLAGEQAVAMLDRFVARGILLRDDNEIRLGEIRLGPSAASHFSAIGIDVGAKPRRPVCRACLDWSVRRSHLAGTLGAAILDKILSEKWARREKDSRAVVFSPPGKQAFERVFLG
ncbi:winged helix-turn-helix domain-containing protein [Mesorhizobium sp. LNJC403B00]|uniref:ArsR/SmtB family transcription factor n=1 Tax=unclassified Mesorhizobium TaxID=325217 RepID=UPI0003CEA177|nr:winged helix-turn-helix domain-containing protein [Mesorhizobium sp. LNJC403B00]ESX94906.1 ArsR family transcriptional regulator [Mesorhizobium sp. LNJC403B00]